MGVAGTQPSGPSARRPTARAGGSPRTRAVPRRAPAATAASDAGERAERDRRRDTRRRPGRRWRAGPATDHTAPRGDQPSTSTAAVNLASELAAARRRRGRERERHREGQHGERGDRDPRGAASAQQRADHRRREPRPATHVAAPSRPVTTAATADRRVRAPRDRRRRSTPTIVAMPGTQVTPTRNIATISCAGAQREPRELERVERAIHAVEEQRHDEPAEHERRAADHDDRLRRLGRQRSRRGACPPSATAPAARPARPRGSRRRAGTDCVRACWRAPGTAASGGQQPRRPLSLAASADQVEEPRLEVARPAHVVHRARRPARGRPRRSRRGRTSARRDPSSGSRRRPCRRPWRTRPGCRGCSPPRPDRPTRTAHRARAGGASAPARRRARSSSSCRPSSRRRCARRHLRGRAAAAGRRPGRAASARSSPNSSPENVMSCSPVSRSYRSTPSARLPISALRVERLLPHIDAVHEGGPGIGSQQPRRHRQRRGLARPVRTDQTVERAVRHVESQVVDRDGTAEPLGQAAESECGSDSVHQGQCDGCRTRSGRICPTCSS